MEGTVRRISRASLRQGRPSIESKDIAEVLKYRRLVAIKLIEKPVFLGACAIALSKLGKNRMVTVFEECIANLCGTEGNAVPVLCGLLEMEFSCRADDPSTMLRGNSAVSRSMVSVIRQKLELTALLGEFIQEWGSRDPFPADEATVALVQSLRSHLELFPQVLKDVCKYVTGLCERLEPLHDAKYRMLGGIVYLRLLGPLLMTASSDADLSQHVTPQVQKNLLATAKALQGASNHQNLSEVTAAANIFLQSLVDAARVQLPESGEEPPSDGDALKLLQLLQVNWNVMEELLCQHHTVLSVTQIQDVGAVLTLAQPFQASLSRSVLTRSGSLTLVNREREEKEFLAEHALDPDFIAAYFECGSRPVDLRLAVRVATLCANVHFGVPQKKGTLVGRDFVDYLMDTTELPDRTKAIKMAQDLLKHELLLPAEKSKTKKVAPFCDGDKFYSFNRDKINQIATLFSGEEDSGMEDRKCPRCGRHGDKVQKWCSYCGYEEGDELG